MTRGRTAVAAIRIVAILHLGAAGTILVAGFAVMAVFSVNTASDPAARDWLGLLWLFYGYAACVLVPQFAGGWGLLARREWARWLLIVISCLYLTLFPIGTLFGGYSLTVLLRSTRDQFVASPPTRAGERLKLLLVMAAVGGVLFAGVWIGLTIDRNTVRSSGPIIGPNGYPIPLETGRPTPPPSTLPIGLPFRIDGPLLPILGLTLLLGGLALGSRDVRRIFRRRMGRVRQSSFAREHAARVAARVAELNADPFRRAYAARVERGEQWSDAQIAYDLDRAALATCSHLQPIERRMRERGVAVKRYGQDSVFADCVVDADALTAYGLLAPPAAYEEYYAPERGPHDIPVAGLFCRLCKASRINLKHPDDPPRRSERFSG